MPEQESPNLQAPIPPAKSHKTLFGLILLVVLLFILAIVWIFLKPKAVIAPVQQTAKPQPAAPPTMSQELDMVNSYSKLSFPIVSSSTAITLAMLPAELSNLIISSSTSVSITKLTFADASQGYSISYTQAAQSPEVFKQLFLVNNKAKIISATNSGFAGILEEQTANYQIKINVVASAQAASNITIIAIFKK